MADDPNKKGADAKRISQQPHEQAYQKRKRKEEAGRSSDTRTSRGGRSSSGGSDSGRSSERGNR